VRGELLLYWTMASDAAEKVKMGVDGGREGFYLYICGSHLLDHFLGRHLVLQYYNDTRLLAERHYSHPESCFLRRLNDRPAGGKVLPQHRLSAAVMSTGMFKMARAC
jgi:hypothetical protein